jgi:hypothetical protein
MAISAAFSQKDKNLNLFWRPSQMRSRGVQSSNQEKIPWDERKAFKSPAVLN